MPGLTLCYARDPAADPGDAAWERSLASTAEERGAGRTLFCDPLLRVGAAVYDGYPLETRVDSGAFVALEGRVYGAPPAEVMARLAEHAALLDHDPAAALRGLGACVAGWDGDFLAVLYARAPRRLCVIGDPLGRLPVYRQMTERGLRMAREPRTLLALGDGHAPDRMGIATLLLFGFPIGERTLIDRMPSPLPGEAVVAEPGGIRIATAPGPQTPLEHKERAGRAPERNAADLAALLIEACRTRAAAVGPAVLGLSGGLDSRAIGAALARAGARFEAATFVDAAGRHEREVAPARRIAEALGAPWHEYRLRAPSGDRLRRLLLAKLGLDTLAGAYGLEFFERLRAAHGDRASFWSGDGGDKALPDHRPRLTARARSDVAAYLIEKHHVWPLEPLARLVGLPAAAIADEVRAVVARYPERTAEQRCVRFLLRERARRWILEGEDANRRHFWTVSPFEARAFLAAALACPDDQKTGHRLYRRLMRQLEPAVLRIEDSNLGIAPGSPLYVANRRVRELSRRFPRLQRLLRPDRRASTLEPHEALMRDLLRRQLEASAAVRDTFSVGALRELAERPDRWGAPALECLITATSAVEQMIEGRTTLDAFADVAFE